MSNQRSLAEIRREQNYAQVRAQQIAANPALAGGRPSSQRHPAANQPQGLYPPAPNQASEYYRGSQYANQQGNQYREQQDGNYIARPFGRFGQYPTQPIMEGQKPPYPNPPPQNAGCCRKCWFCVFPYFKFKSWTFAIWCLFTLYSLILSIYIIQSTERNTCVYYQFGASYAPAVKLHFHLHRWFLSFFMHQSLLQLPFHWLINSYTYFLAGFEVQYFIGYKPYLILQVLLQLGSALFSQNISGQEKISFGASGVILGLFGFHAMRLFLGLQNINTPYGCRLIIFPLFALLSILLSTSDSDRWGHLGGILLGILFAPYLFYIPWRRRMEKHQKRNKLLSLAFLGLGIASLLILIITLFFVVDLVFVNPCS